MTLLLLLSCSRPDVEATPIEVCNGRDDDGDGAVDEGLRATWYADADGDGWGVAPAVTFCVRERGWAFREGDCDDANAGRSPDVVETCDGVDQDCDGEVDEGVLQTWYADADRDGWGADPAVSGCRPDPLAVEVGGDCDDADSTVSPDAAERCDGVDQDCDGVIDEEVGATWHPDADGDGFGDAETSTEACDAPAGFTPDASDCDDASAAVNPTGVEACNTWSDEDCDGGAGDCPLAGELDLTLADRWFDVESDGARGLAGGDLDGDGYDDLVIGRPSWREDSLSGSDPVYEMGAVSVVYGGPEAVGAYGEPEDGVFDATLESDVTDVVTDLGTTVAIADIDGDGILDLLAGAPGWEGGGRVWVAPGGEAWALSVRGEDEEGELGTRLATGDGDGDGVSDLFVGEQGRSASVFLVAGPLVESTAEESATAEWWGDYPTMNACDLDADGLSDFVVGTGGGVYLWTAPHAGRASAANAAITIEGTAMSASVCTDGDSDGYTDLFVGNNSDDTLAANAGAIHRVAGPITASVSVTETLYGETELDQLGAAVAAAGDVDGDDRPDLLVGAPGYDPGGTNAAGAAWLLSGADPASVVLADAPRFTFATGSEAVGTELGAAGDTNADGYDDFLLAGGSFADDAWLVLGRGL